MVDQMKHNATLVDALGSSLRRGDRAIGTVPALVRRVLEEDAWRDFETSRGELVHHERFADFVTTAPLKGLGASVDLVRRIVKDDVETLDRLDQALKQGSRPGARTDLFDNVQEVKAPDGNSESAALRRLRKDAPDLHGDVLAGRLSAHAAMVKAGFRPRTFTVRGDRPDSIAQTLRKNLSAEQLAELRRLLNE